MSRRSTIGFNEASLSKNILHWTAPSLIASFAWHFFFDFGSRNSTAVLRGVILIQNICTKVPFGF